MNLWSQLLNRVALAISVLLSPVVSAELMQNGKLAPAHIAALAAGDPAQSAKAGKKCQKCHGTDGVSDDDEVPHLAGQNPRYLYKQMMDFKEDHRDGGRMNKTARKLSQEDIANIIVRYASNPLPAMAEIVVPEAPVLVSRGDAGREVNACADCHGAKGEGSDSDYNSPVLAGMPYDYFVMAMEAFKDGSRENDPDGVMGKNAKQLNDEEIETLANYYLALGQRERIPLD